MRVAVVSGLALLMGCGDADGDGGATPPMWTVPTATPSAPSSPSPSSEGDGARLPQPLVRQIMGAGGHTTNYALSGGREDGLPC